MLLISCCFLIKTSQPLQPEYHSNRFSVSSSLKSLHPPLSLQSIYCGSLRSLITYITTCLLKSLQKVLRHPESDNIDLSQSRTKVLNSYQTVCGKHYSWMGVKYLREIKRKKKKQRFAKDLKLIRKPEKVLKKRNKSIIKVYVYITFKNIIILFSLLII